MVLQGRVYFLKQSSVFQRVMMRWTQYPSRQPAGRRTALFWIALVLIVVRPVIASEAPVASAINEAFREAPGTGKPDHLGQMATVSGVLLSDPIVLSSGLALADIQDDSGAATLFTPVRDMLIGRVQRGDRVIARGKISAYYGNRELVLTDIGRIGRAPLPLPKDLQIADLYSNKYTGELIRLTGKLQPGPGSHHDLILRDASGVIPVEINADLLLDKKFSERCSYGGQASIIGICNRFAPNAHYRLLPRDQTDFSFAPLPPYRLIAAGLAALVLAGFAALLTFRHRQRQRLAQELREEARHAAEERDRFFTLSLDMLCITSRSGEMKRLNPAFSQTLGWSTEEMLARPFADFVHPDDQPATFQALSELAAGRPSHGFENRCRHRDGTWRVLSWRGVLEGEIIYATARDVTDQRVAEAALRALNGDLERRVLERTAEMQQALATLDATEDGAFIFDPDSLRFTYVNEGAVRQLGYARAELLKMTAFEIEVDYDESGFRTLLAPMLRGERRSQQITTVHRHRDGREIPVEINLQYVAPAGERPRFISMVRDITERHRAEALVRRSQRLDAVGTLAGGVAHDINNALTPILLGLGALRSRYPDASRLIETMQASAAHGSYMVRQLLGFAKRSEGHPAEIHPALLLEEIQQIAGYTFPKDIKIEVECQPDCPCVRGDPTQLHQVLLNLCVNARDAMPEGGSLTLEATAAVVAATSSAATPGAAPGRYVLLRVTDTGIGMSPDVAERIFDPFFTTKGPDKGTGLGLSTAVSIVRGHGGFLQVDTRLGQGSSFSVYLPAWNAKRPVERRPAPATPLEGNQEKILVVDDEPAVRIVAEIVLRRLNFDPILASDGRDGLQQVAKYGSELSAIITDLHMPVMGGLDFVRALRRIEPSMPVLVTSGRLEESEQEECTRLDVLGIIEKPFSEDQLAEMLKRALAGGS